MKFRLRRYFLLTSLPVVALAIVLTAYAYVHFATSVLVAQETTANQHKTRFLSKLLWPRFQSYITWSKDQDTASLRAATAVAEIDKVVTDLFRGTDVMKVKLYNFYGLTVYSSEFAQIGNDKSDNPGFISASNGKALSNLTQRDEFHAFEKVIMDRDVVSSYLPLYDTHSREVIAVIEMYSDVTDVVARIRYTRNKVIYCALACFTILLGALYLLMARADRLIRSQHEDLASANKEISRLAYLDAVTQLPNRHLFDLSIEKQIHYSRRNCEGFALLYIDLDDFKDINDNHGHAVGDLVLSAIAQKLKQTVRGTDAVYRVGGDEFAVILPGARTLENASQVAENLLQNTKEPIMIGNNTYAVSISIGVACYPESASDAETIIKLADDAMYSAKTHGKNNYEMAKNIT